MSSVLGYRCKKKETKTEQDNAAKSLFFLVSNLSGMGGSRDVRKKRRKQNKMFGKESLLLWFKPAQLTHSNGLRAVLGGDGARPVLDTATNALHDPREFLEGRDDLIGEEKRKMVRGMTRAKKNGEYGESSVYVVYL